MRGSVCQKCICIFCGFSHAQLMSYQSHPLLSKGRTPAQTPNIVIRLPEYWDRFTRCVSHFLILTTAISRVGAILSQVSPTCQSGTDK